MLYIIKKYDTLYAVDADYIKNNNIEPITTFTIEDIMHAGGNFYEAEDGTIKLGKSEERILTELRQQREMDCFTIINRGQFWYDTLTEAQKEELKVWYKAWLDVTETKIIPEKPTWLK